MSFANFNNYHLTLPTLNTHSLPFIITTTALTTLTLSALARRALTLTTPRRIASPTESLLPTLSATEIAALPYPPDLLPGGRNVTTPYGNVRVYEWGPEDGRKVLLLHGISTPCIALGAVAHGLVARGCRVMLMDLWGRGYSDSPADLPHDDRLYTTEILLAITSSPLSWTGSGSAGNFSLIGYSLGGGIAANFTSYFPHLVRDLVLLAPSGLIRPRHMSSRSRLLYSHGLVPEGLLLYLVKRRLKTPMYSDKQRKTDVRDAAVAEVKGGAEFSFQDAPLSLSRPDVTVVKAVQWQLGAHDGFVRSFMSSIRFAPITGQEASWQRLGLRFGSVGGQGPASAAVPGSASGPASVPPSRPTRPSTNPRKVLIFGGLKDPIIYPEELKEDAMALMGEQAIDFRFVDGAHDFVITHAEEVVRGIGEVWGL